MSIPSQRLSNEDKLEELECCIGLMKEEVEKLENAPCSDKELDTFMRYYIELEDKIISLMEYLSQLQGINQEKMETLTNVFNKYWGEYQDSWSDKYWNIYNTHRQIKDNEGNGKRLIPDNDTGNVNNNLEEDLNLDDISNNPFNTLKAAVQSKTKTGSSSTHDESMTMSYLCKIDEEMKEVQEISITKDKKEEKRRSCLDCVIF